MDVGVKDEFGFARHYDHFVAMLQSKGLSVDIRDGFSSNCADLPGLDSQFTYVRYDAGHVGVAGVDPDALLDGHICGEDTVWQRILAMIGFLNESFPDGFYGPGGDFDLPDIDFVAAGGGAAPARPVVLYRPPAFFHSDEDFPVVYFLGGYGQEPDDFRRVGDLLDVLILSGQLQNMFFVFVPGDGGQKGSFYVNHAIADAQAADIEAPTSGRHEDSLLQDLIPEIEDRLLERRVRR
jgi:hypothetical protein